MNDDRYTGPRTTVVWHPRDGHVPGVYVPQDDPEFAAEIVATSNWFKPVRKES